ncbi:hypothetical protein DEO72_LG11g2678 [Vigna unguiculata]|uniref:Uncharacterized protein n=1 Tax=Vigna unguiculata TaxID=3917 RepID=A0A4D6NPX6_VIGUN|nr:hypothetical protein DEO72_LG11g2678 [Vigna unguiculata]
MTYSTFADELLRSMGCEKKGEETPRKAIRKKKSNGEVSSVLAQSTRKSLTKT